jgi:ankyrin repeat protein
MQGHVSMLEHLHNSSSSSLCASTPTAGGITALHLAAAAGHLDAVRWLLQHPGPSGTPNSSSSSSSGGGQQVVAAVLQQGPCGATPLHLAVLQQQGRYLEVVDALLAAGSDAGAQVVGGALGVTRR